MCGKQRKTVFIDIKNYRFIHKTDIPDVCCRSVFMQLIYSCIFVAGNTNIDRKSLITESAIFSG